MHVWVGYTSVNGVALAKMKVLIGSIHTPLFTNISLPPHVILIRTGRYRLTSSAASTIPLTVPDARTVRYECSSVTGKQERRAQLDSKNDK